MNKVIFLMITTLLFSCAQPDKVDQQTSLKESVKDHIAIYDFHTDHRCETCLAIEKATKLTLETNFKSQLDNETVTFTLINADASENQAIAEEYSAFGTTLAISIVKEGKKEIIDITNWAFDAVHGDDFESELTDKLNSALAKL
jgi:hypothetical protein